MFVSLETKIKHKILDEFNADLYRNFNMTLSDADDLYGWGFGHIYKVINRVFKNYGPQGLRRETKYIIQYLDFLLNKLQITLSISRKELPYSNYEYDLEFYKGYFALMYFLRYYRHYGYRGISDPNQLKFEFYI